MVVEICNVKVTLAAPNASGLAGGLPAVQAVLEMNKIQIEDTSPDVVTDTGEACPPRQHRDITVFHACVYVYQHGTQAEGFNSIYPFQLRVYRVA